MLDDGLKVLEGLMGAMAVDDHDDCESLAEGCLLELGEKQVEEAGVEFMFILSLFLGE